MARTLVNIRRDFFWKNQKRAVEDYIKECQICQRTKARQTKPPGLLRQHAIPSGRWEEISMDFITNLPTTVRGKFTSLWTIICRLTKRLLVIPVKDTTDSQVLAYIWNKDYVSTHGLPKTIICDRDSRFTSSVWQNLMKLQKTSIVMSTGYRSETAGQAERSHRFIEDYFRCFLVSGHKVWNEYLGTGEYAFNASHNTTIGMTPFEADIGYIPPLQYDLVPEEKQDHEMFLKYQLQRLEWAKDQMLHSQERAQKFYNRNRPIQEFMIGDMVLLSTEDLAMKHIGSDTKRKFAARWIGPFAIAERISTDTYKLNMGNVRLYNVYHTSKLKPFYAKTNTIEQPVEVLLADGDQGYIVEKIIGRRIRRKKLQYQVKWLGTPETTWEPADNLTQVLGLIEEFEITSATKKKTSNNKTDREFEITSDNNRE